MYQLYSFAHSNLQTQNYTIRWS